MVGEKRAVLGSFPMLHTASLLGVSNEYVLRGQKSPDPCANLLSKTEFLVNRTKDASRSWLSNLSGSGRD